MGPNTYKETKRSRGRRSDDRMTRPLLDGAKVCFFLAAATVLGLLFDYMGSQEANIITVYILAVMLCAIATTKTWGFIASAGAVTTFNFFFTEPRYTFRAYDPDYTVTFIVMFLVAAVTGSLAAKLKEHATETSKAAYRTKVLFDTSQLLQAAHDRETVMDITAGQLIRLLGRDVVAYTMTDGELEGPLTYPAGKTPVDPACSGDREREAARLALKGETVPGALCCYQPIRAEQHVYGVMGVVVADGALDSYDSGLLMSILGECALGLENQRNIAEKEAAAFLAKQEQLQANLLRSISHDLRTPLTSISGNASNLLSNGETFDSETKKQIYTDIYDDALWLMGLVENLLAESRMGGGDSPQLRLSTELIEDVIEEALRHIDRRREDYRITVDTGEDYLFARMDVKLIVQVIINIVNNAIKYTPPGSSIHISARRRGDMAEVSIRDNGPGIPDSVKPHIFEMFYSGMDHIGDSRRSLGLGLALCRSIIAAHGGELTVEDNIPHGAVFTFTLPAGEVTLHE